LLLASISSSYVVAQNFGEYIEDERALYAETKQINQFIRRFNGEEDVKGERLYAKDNDYRSRKLRKKYLPILFNLNSSVLNDQLKETFINNVMDKKAPIYLDFHGGDFFAEVKTIFNYKGKDEELTLFLKLQEEQVGSKWVISHIYFKPFKQSLNGPDTTVFNDSKFLHPLSHELGFMNLFRVFNDPDSVEYYFAGKYSPDYLSLFLFEIKNKRLKFKTVTNVKFHFFQVDNWYFELSYYNREGYNTGWLISNLLEITVSDKQLLMKYIYHE
jgi:hypothetical protein